MSDKKENEFDKVFLTFLKITIAIAVFAAIIGAMEQGDEKLKQNKTITTPNRIQTTQP